MVGALARLDLSGKQHLSIVATLLIGVAGSVVGGVIANLLGTGDVFGVATSSCARRGSLHRRESMATSRRVVNPTLQTAT